MALRRSRVRVPLGPPRKTHLEPHQKGGFEMIILSIQMLHWQRIFAVPQPARISATLFFNYMLAKNRFYLLSVHLAQELDSGSCL